MLSEPANKKDMWKQKVRGLDACALYSCKEERGKGKPWQRSSRNIKGVRERRERQEGEAGSRVKEAGEREVERRTERSRERAASAQEAGRRKRAREREQGS